MFGFCPLRRQVVLQSSADCWGFIWLLICSQCGLHWGGGAGGLGGRRALGSAKSQPDLSAVCKPLEPLMFETNHLRTSWIISKVEVLWEILREGMSMSVRVCVCVYIHTRMHTCLSFTKNAEKKRQEIQLQLTIIYVIRFYASLLDIQ